MANLKRDEIKYIRDGIKTQYPKGDSCEACGGTDNLQYHHYTSLTPLWNKWKKKNDIVVKDADHMLELREYFYDDHAYEVIDYGVTLCTTCHNVKLHGVYGKVPGLGTAKKQERWVKKQAIKNGLIPEE